MEILAPTIPAESWNDVRAVALRSRPFQGLGVRLHWTRHGIIVTAKDAEEFRHPWQLSPRWKPDDKGGGTWVTTVRPGFVNGRDVTTAVTIEGAERDVPLIDEPEIVLANFRDPAAASGVSATLAGDFQQSAGEGYPAFFDTLGVRPAAADGPVGAGEVDSTRTRQIRACDVVLITPRLATRQSITVTDPRATGQTVDLGIEFIDTALNSAASAHRIIATAKHSGPPEPTLLERFEGTAVEPETDELKLSTVYLVSPTGVGEDEEPNEQWTAYPMHFVFWNLAHASLAQFPEAPPQPLRVDVPLAGGTAQPVINGLLALSNDANSALAAFLGAANFRGIYWAPSGIGVATLDRPEAATPKQSAGLDPRARRLQRSQTRAAITADIPPLNPPFPYLKTPFDPFYFGLHERPETANASE